MDTNNIKFLGYAPDRTFQKACKKHENPLSLESFFGAVNQDTANGCCSCCKQEVKVFAMMQYNLPIKPGTLGLCVECASKLPLELEVHNLGSNGAPPMLAYKITRNEV